MEVLQDKDFALGVPFIDVYIISNERRFKRLELGKIYRLKRASESYLSRWYFSDITSFNENFFSMGILYSTRELTYRRELIRYDTITDIEKFELSLTTGMSRYEA